MWNNTTFYKALNFAELAHRAQKMKYPEGAPYLMHVSSVAMLVTKYCAHIKNINADLAVTVALLHDTIEDTSTTKEQIEKEFGKDVAKCVLSLSKNEKVEKDLQIEDSINRILKLPKTLVRETAIVKMSDRLFNIRCHVPFWDKQHCDNYKLETQLIYDKLGWANSKLKKDLLQAIKQY